MPAVSDNPSDFCEAVQQQLAAYALGERDIDSEVQAHLESCPTCWSDLLAYAKVTRVLPYSAPDVAPPAALRERIIADASKPIVVAPPKTRPALPPPVRRPRRPSGLWVGLGCAIVALLVSLGWNVSLQRTLNTQTAQITTSREGWQTTIVLLNDPAVKAYAVNGDQARGRVWTTPGGKVGCLVVQGLPAVADNQVYQVWLTQNGAPTSAGTFEERNGNAWTLIRTDDALNNYTNINITVEPRGGSTTLQGPSVLRGTFGTATTMDATAQQMWLQIVMHEALRDS